MKTIWKYYVPIIPGEFELDLPIRFEILSYGKQSETSSVMWVLCSPKANKIKVKFLVAWTGCPIESKAGEDLKFIGTIKLGLLVFHLFQIVEG